MVSVIPILLEVDSKGLERRWHAVIKFEDGPRQQSSRYVAVAVTEAVKARRSALRFHPRTKS